MSDPIATEKLVQAIVDMQAPHPVMPTNNSDTQTEESNDAILYLPPPCPITSESNFKTLHIKLDVTNPDMPSLHPLPIGSNPETRAIDIEEGLQTPMSTDNILSTSGTDEDPTSPIDIIPAAITTAGT